MCTAITYQTKDTYFGRTLDYDFSYGEDIVIMPRNFLFPFHNKDFINKKNYAIIGMAHLAENVPLFHEAVNEKGLGIAGLNFVGNAYYSKEKIEGKDNVATFELIPWILTRCATVAETRKLLKNMNLIDRAFNEKLPVATLHWIIADRKETITLEVVKDGIKIYENPVGVLTNNPPFKEQMFQLNNYMHLSAKDPKNCFSDKLSLQKYSRGMGALGLPGDLSSQSRFIRAAFVKMNAVSLESEIESVNQFFHILGSVEQQRGCCDVGDGKYEITIYTSCYNMNQGIFYYTTYENHQITAVSMYREELDSDQIISYPLIQKEQIKMQN